MTPIPVWLLTGFLGAGKTTLLNRLLGDAAMADAAVIVNEFGDIGVDNLIVEASGDSMIELSGGCLCCTMGGALTETLADLVDRMQTGRIRPLSRVVIETTGLADPGPVIGAIVGHPVLAQAYRLDGVITVVDAVNGDRTLDEHAESVAQVAAADLIALAKTDLAEATALRRRLSALNPEAPVVEAARLDFAAAFAGLAGAPAGGSSNAAGNGGHDHGDGHAHDHEAHDHDGHDHRGHAGPHDRAVRSFVIAHDAPIDRLTLGLFLDLVLSAHGDGLLRLKGLARTAEDGDRPLVVQAVRRALSPPFRLKAWTAQPATRLVFIGKDLDETAIRGVFSAFVGRPVADQADRSALTDNPLAVPGLRL